MKSAKSVLIIGGSGFLGMSLALKLREEHRVVVTHLNNYVPIRGVLSVPLDLKDANWLRQIVYKRTPEVIIYAAGYRDKDIAWIEDNRPAAERAMSGGVADVLKVADIFQPRMIYLSNCYVFEGSRGNYKETDGISPQNTMGKLKVGGENVIKNRASNYTIIRSSPIYGRSHPWRPTFVDDLRLKLVRGERVELQHYERHSFAPIDGFTTLISKVIEQAPRKGVFHYGGLTRLTHYEFGKLFCEQFGLDSNLLIAKRQAGKGSARADAAVADYSLNSTEVVKTFQLPSLEVEDGLKGLI